MGRGLNREHTREVSMLSSESKVRMLHVPMANKKMA